MKQKDWNSAIYLPWKKLSNEEWRWVDPSSFFDTLPKALERCPPLPAAARRGGDLRAGALGASSCGR
ncbi:MAG TPA: hypothetical protein VLB11_01715 [Methyloceanibacter sp.]|nr:hypothetical protein [Methyloceanibacter sp.]